MQMEACVKKTAEANKEIKVKESSRAGRGSGTVQVRRGPVLGAGWARGARREAPRDLRRGHRLREVQQLDDHLAKHTPSQVQ